MMPCTDSVLPGLIIIIGLAMLFALAVTYAHLRSDERIEREKHAVHPCDGQ